MLMTSLLNMTESGCVDQSKNGSFQNQKEQASTSELPPRRRKQSPPIWEPLMKKKAPRGNPTAGVVKQLQQAQARRSAAVIASNASKELKALAAHMPEIPDADARKLALRMYHLELSDGVSPKDAQIKVGKMFFITLITVKRWAESWETTGEEAFEDCRSASHESERSFLFACPDLVIELKCWIKKRLQQGGKHEDGYLTLQSIQNHVNDVLLKDHEVVSPEVLDLHEERYHSRAVSKMTVSRWVHKLGFKWADSSKAPFCDRHEDEDIVTYRNTWVKTMLALKPRLPLLNESTGLPTWPNLPVGERPLMHGNHDEAILYMHMKVTVLLGSPRTDII